MGRRGYLSLTLLALLWHGTWLLIRPFPIQWDAWYYLAVAKHIAAGEGAITEGLWSLIFLPEHLPMPADLYWMPLPSRVLVPGLWLWPEGGAQLTLLALLCAWPVLAAILAQDLGARPFTAWFAGIFACLGGGYIAILDQTDSHALLGVLGSLSLWAVARQKRGMAVLLACLLALSRNDGFLLGLMLAFGFRGVDRWRIALAGPLSLGVWTLRGAFLFGPGFWQARALAGQTSDFFGLLDGVNRAPIGWLDHFRLFPNYLPEIFAQWARPGFILLFLPALFALWRFRASRWVQVTALWWLIDPLIVVALAPAVADHGTLLRTGAAVLPAVLVLSVLGIYAIFAPISRKTKLHPDFLPSMLLAPILVGQAGLGGVQRDKTHVHFAECAFADKLPAGPVFSSQPMAMEVLCGRPGLMFTKYSDPARLAEVARRYHAVGAVVHPARSATNPSVAGADDLARLFPQGQDLAPGVRRLSTRAEDPQDLGP